MRGRLLGLLTVLIGISLASASGRAALVALDTYPADGVLWKPIAIGVPFTDVQGTIVTGIQAAIRGSTGPIEFGIMGDAGDRPSDSFLFSQTITPTLDADVHLTGLDWTLPNSGQFWITTVESLDFSVGDGFWQANANLNRPWAFKATLDGPWFLFPDMTPAVRLEVISVPEPAFTWFPAALLFILLALRRSRAQP